MAPELGMAVIAVVLFALIVIRLAHRGSSRQPHPPAVSKPTTSALSVHQQMRAVDEASATMGPAAIREVEDHIPTVDDGGNRRTLIRMRTLETVLGPAGPTEVERDRRYTLPGHGHVSRLSDTEFEIFHDHVKLRLDVHPRNRTKPFRQPPFAMHGCSARRTPRAAGKAQRRRTYSE